MKALIYLVFTNIKNSIKELIKRPAKLIVILFFIAILGFVIWAGDTSGGAIQSTENIQELYAGVFAVFAMLFILSIMTGFSSGASFFSMSDVNIMFLSPISPKKILIYGLIKQMSQSFMIGFFIFFQYSWIESRYRIGIYGLFAILLGFAITVFCAQLTSMVIYSFTNHNEKLKKTLKTSIISVCIIILVILAKDVLFSSNENKITSLINSLNAMWVNFIPVVGWAKAITTSLISYDLIQSNLILIITSLALVVFYIIGFITLIIKYNVDFYEDVLQATEVTFSAITAKKEGKISDTPKNVKLGKTGIKKGSGSNVFFHKHMLENRRSGGFLLDKSSIFIMITTIIFALIFRGFDNDAVSAIIPVFVFTTYMQIFSVSMGRWIRELLQPYVYMIPESPFKKLISILKESVIKVIIEAIVLFIIIGLILKSPVSEIVFCIIARIGFGILFIAGNILIERILGTLTNKMMIMFLYIIIMLVIAVPGFIVGLLISFAITFFPQVIVILASTFIWNLLASTLIIFLCRDILNYAELNNR